MNFIEKHGNKIAAALCFASFLPMGYTIFAQDGDTTNPSNQASADTDAVNEISDNIFYVEPSVTASVDQPKEEDSAAAKEADYKEASQKKAGSEASKDQEPAQKEEAPAQPENEQPVQEEPAAQPIQEEAPVITQEYVPMDTAPVVPVAETIQPDVPYVDSNVQIQPEIQTLPVVDQTFTVTDQNLTAGTTQEYVPESAPSQPSTLPSEFVTTTDTNPVLENTYPSNPLETMEFVSSDQPGVYSSNGNVQTMVTEPMEIPAEQAPAQQPVEETLQNPVELEPVEGPINTVEPDQQVSAGVQEQPVAEETQPVVEDTQQNVQITVEDVATQDPSFDTEVSDPITEDVPAVDSVVTPSSDINELNAAITNSALSLVDATNGLQCTEVAAMALQMAGIDAINLDPAGFAQYGYYTDTPTAGNLVIYDNAGLGYAHIAIYIGNGNAVHGNYFDADGNSSTVVAPVEMSGVGNYGYLQVLPQ